MNAKKLVCMCLALCFPLAAEPWIDTSNIFLRENIQRLADAGYITTPVTTFPLMWSDIARDLKNINHSALSTSNRNAYHYISHNLKLAKKSKKKIEINATTQDKRFTDFGGSFRDGNAIKVHNSFLSDSFAAKLESGYTFSPNDGDNVRFDGSYVAAFWKNWIISVGMQDRWWGPGWDTNLSLTNNARPIPAIALSRKSAVPLKIPYTDIEIPWTVTSFMGIMDDDRIIKDTLLWGFRLNFKPFDNLEIGLTRLAQWGGENRPQDASTFWNVLIGKDNCGAGGLNCGQDRSQEPGNQQAGYDLRYSFNINELPIAIYGQYFAEDGDDSSSFSFLTEPKIQVGVDSHFNIFNVPTMAYIEYTDTFADCTDTNADETGNCFYEHHIYQTGMRYKQRTLGNLYDNDATSIVIGTVSNINKNLDMTLKLRFLELNQDNSDKAPNNPIIGNPLTKVAEDMVMLSTKVQYSYERWRYTLGTDLSKSTYENNIKDKSEINLFLNIEYYL